MAAAFARGDPQFFAVGEEQQSDLVAGLERGDRETGGDVGRAFAQGMEKIITAKIAAAREVTLAEVDSRSLPAKLRDAVARLFSPYL